MSLEKGGCQGIPAYRRPPCQTPSSTRPQGHRSFVSLFLDIRRSLEVSHPSPEMDGPELSGLPLAQRSLSMSHSGDRLCWGHNGRWGSENRYLRGQRDPTLGPLVKPMAGRTPEEEERDVWSSAVRADGTPHSCPPEYSDPGGMLTPLAAAPHLEFLQHRWQWRRQQ